MKNAQTPRTTTRRAAAPTLPIPPMVAALAMLTEPEGDGVPSEFAAAWPHMPRLSAALVAGHAHSNSHLSRMDLIEAAIANDIERSREANIGNKLPQAIELMNAADEDMYTDVITAISYPAFYTGFALACYLLTIGQTHGENHGGAK